MAHYKLLNHLQRVQHYNTYIVTVEYQFTQFEASSTPAEIDCKPEIFSFMLTENYQFDGK